MLSPFKSVPFFVLLLALLASPASAKKHDTGFLDRTLSWQGAAYKYQVFVPEDWTPKKSWPIILFLHGAGERGNDGLLQTDVGLPQAIRLNRGQFPTIVVIPQCLKDHWWPDSPMDDVAMESLRLAQLEFHGDPQHTYLTGLSMGGYGSWHLAGKYPGKFAAVVAICGGILIPQASRAHPAEDLRPYTEAARKIGSATPVWIFHGGSDETVPVAESQRMNEAMKALGGEVHYTEYPAVGHNSWDKAYAEPELMPWLLSKSLGKNSAK
jgi:predicted peptidase